MRNRGGLCARAVLQSQQTKRKRRGSSQTYKEPRLLPPRRDPDIPDINIHTHTHSQRTNKHIFCYKITTSSSHSINPSNNKISSFNTTRLWHYHLHNQIPLIGIESFKNTISHHPPTKDTKCHPPPPFEILLPCKHNLPPQHP